MRIFVGWNNGCYITSLDHDFQDGLEELVKQFGPPDIVEFRNNEHE